MPLPIRETIAIRVTEREHALIARLAELEGMSASDLVRELLGLEREPESPTLRQLRVVRGDWRAPTVEACLPLHP
jgi:hypothetical protein